jgi:hypothetical protein
MQLTSSRLIGVTDGENGSSNHIAMGQGPYIQCVVTKRPLYKGENGKHYLYL